MKVVPSLAFLDPWIVLVVLQGIENVLLKVVGQNGPRNDAANEKGDDKKCGQDNLDRGKGFAEAWNTVDGVKVGQQAQDSGGYFGQSDKEEGVVVADFGYHASVGSNCGKDVMKDKDGSIVKDDCIVEILDLVGGKE